LTFPLQGEGNKNVPSHPGGGLGLGHVSWRAGIAFGSMYAGIVGIPERCEYTTLGNAVKYTTLGNAVNFSARLMIKANFGEVLVAESLTSHAKFTFEHKGDFQYKGFSHAVPTHRLMSKKSVYERFHVDIMIGRQAELHNLQAWVQPIYEGKFAGIAYLYGEAGIGKSRLIFEFYRNLENMTWFSCQCDSILKQPLNTFVYTLKRYFNQDNSDSIAERKAKF